MPSSLRKIKVRSKFHERRQRQKKVSLKAIFTKEEKRARLYFLVGGLLLIFAAFYTSSRSSGQTENNNLNHIDNEFLSASFADEPVKVDQSFLATPSGQTVVKAAPDRIVIPSLNIDIPVKTAQIINGYWQVFSDSAGFGLGSAYPGEMGNTVIFAHARKNLFAPLKDITTGAQVTVYIKNQLFLYTVSEIKEVLPSQTDTLAPTSDSTLTLYTCSGFRDSKRLIVTAKRG